MDKHTLKQSNRYMITSQQPAMKQHPKSLTHRSYNQIPPILKSFHPLTQRSNKPETQQNPQQHQISLPSIKLKKVLSKIGATTRRQCNFNPTEEQLRQFRAKKLRQLKDSYPFETKKRSGEAFKYELDEIVLDCYEHGEMHGKKTVWRKYRHNVDALSFDTMKVLHKK